MRVNVIDYLTPAEYNFEIRALVHIIPSYVNVEPCECSDHPENLIGIDRGGLSSE